MEHSLWQKGSRRIDSCKETVSLMGVTGISCQFWTNCYKTYIIPLTNLKRSRGDKILIYSIYVENIHNWNLHATIGFFDNFSHSHIFIIYSKKKNYNPLMICIVTFSSSLLLFLILTSQVWYIGNIIYPLCQINKQQRQRIININYIQIHKSHPRTSSLNTNCNAHSV